MSTRPPALVLDEITALRQRTDAEMGLQFLIRARECFKASDNENTAERVRLAISSARGAVRACEDRVKRSCPNALAFASYTVSVVNLTDADAAAFRKTFEGDDRGTLSLGPKPGDTSLRGTTYPDGMTDADDRAFLERMNQLNGTPCRP